jgi:hypothetical protein
MTTLRIERVTALPSTVTASTMYFVKSAESPFFELYVTSSDGLDTRHVINKSEIGTLITDAVAGLSNIISSATITTRDALVLTANALVLVLDATGDTTVAAGAAMYFYDFTATTWTKVTEYESLDLSLTWANIANKPSSIVADIDDAVSKKHAHTNSAALAKIGEDTDGKLTYNSAGVEATIAVSDW